ncbi:LOW QUALITY PROTEIN: neuropeptide B, partial [Ciconia maguari]
PAAGSPAPPSINVRPPLASTVSGALLRSASVRGVGRAAPWDPPAGAESGSAGRGRVGVGTGTGTGPGGQGPSATRGGLRGRRRAAPSPRAPPPREDGPRAGEAGPPPGYKGGGGALRSRRHQAPCPLARLLCRRRPAEAWCKQAAGPRRYVGRAPGLRSGLRRSDTDGTAERGPGVLLPGSARPPMRLQATLSTGAAPGVRGAVGAGTAPHGTPGTVRAGTAPPVSPPPPPSPMVLRAAASSRSGVLCLPGAGAWQGEDALPGDPGPRWSPLQALCVTDVAPEPRSCRALPGAPGAFQCKTDVTVSLDPGCLSADA